MSLLLCSPCNYFIYMPRLSPLCSCKISHLPIPWDLLGCIVIRRLSSSTLSFARTGMLAYMWSHLSERHSTWHVENAQLRCDEWKCDPVLQENIGAIDKSGNRTKWGNQELSQSLVFPLFEGHTNSWHSGPLMVMSLTTSLPLISCPKPTRMLKVWGFVHTHYAVFFQTPVPFHLLSPCLESLPILFTLSSSYSSFKLLHQYHPPRMPLQTIVEQV